jgi:PPP family 3-phenylpropionic acid transporter
MPHGRLAVWYFWYFAFIGAFLPYFALYLQSIGMSAGRIAMLMSLGQFMRLVAPLLWSWLADSGGRRVRIVVASTAAALASFSVVFLTAGLSSDCCSAWPSCTFSGAPPCPWSKR